VGVYNPATFDNEIHTTVTLEGVPAQGYLNITIPQEASSSRDVELTVSARYNDLAGEENLELDVSSYIIDLDLSSEEFLPGDTIVAEVRVLNTIDMSPADDVRVYYRIDGKGVSIDDRLDANNISFTVPEHGSGESYGIEVNVWDVNGEAASGDWWVYATKLENIRGEFELEYKSYEPGEQMKVTYRVYYEDFDVEIDDVLVIYSVWGLTGGVLELNQSEGEFLMDIPADSLDGKYIVEFTVSSLYEPMKDPDSESDDLWKSGYTMENHAESYHTIRVEKEDEPSGLEKANSALGIESASPFMLILLALALMGLVLNFYDMHRNKKGSGIEPTRESGEGTSAGGPTDGSHPPAPQQQEFAPPETVIQEPPPASTDIPGLQTVSGGDGPDQPGPGQTETQQQDPPVASQSTPGQTSPGQPVPEPIPPGQTPPGQPVPEQTSPEQSIPGQTAPPPTQDGSPQESAGATSLQPGQWTCSSCSAMNDDGHMFCMGCGGTRE